MSVEDWLAAFLLTQAFEMPIYWVASRARPWASRLAYAFGASAVTHPIIWFCLPWPTPPHNTPPYIPLLLAAETFVFLVEGVWGKAWRVPRPWIASLIANVTSLALGSVVRWAFL